MVDSDDKITNDETEMSGTDEQAPAAMVAAPESEPSAKTDELAEEGAPVKAGAERRERDHAFIQDLIGISVKTLAVVLSVVVLILSILTVATPLSAMRVFNKLGMYERALNSGTQYIERRLMGADAAVEDEFGQFTALKGKGELADDDMFEALDVCINLSDMLMKEYEGKDEASSKYFAQKLDRDIRIYLSCDGALDRNKAKSAQMLLNVPVAGQPYVYDYTHTMMKMAYAARVRNGEFNKMFDRLSAGDEAMADIGTLMQTYHGVEPGTRDLVIVYLDGFCDFIGQLNAYIDLRMNALGVVGYVTELPEDKEKYTGVLDGSEFELYVTWREGFKPIFTNWLDRETFTRWAEMAVEFVPQTLDEQLHQLYWLSELVSYSNNMFNMGKLLNYNAEAYGGYSKDVSDTYSSWVFHYYRELYFYEDDDHVVRSHGTLVGKYNTYMRNYSRQFTA